MSSLWKNYLIIFLLLASLLISTGVLYAVTSSRIDATVKISICGNGIKEGGEDCDDQDFGSENCGSLGYTHGFLGCKNDCTYNDTLCIVVPSPTPTITPIVTLTPTITTTTGDQQQSQSNQSSSTTTSEAAISVAPSPTPATGTPFIEALVQELLPDDMKRFDINGDNSISRDELVSGLAFWVSSWRDSRNGDGNVNNCDVNTDRICNLRDFSVILYYYNSI